MARIQPNKTPAPAAQEKLEAVQKKVGFLPNIHATFAHSPAVLNFYLSAAGALAETTISPALREQIALTVAGANKCDYCASAHTAIGKKQSLTEQELAQNLKAKSGDAKVQAALTFVQKVMASHGQVSDADVQAVRSAGYSDAEVVEIMAVIGINIFTNYFNLVVGTDVDFPFTSAS